MSSPASRHSNRNSLNGTPRRSSQRGSQALINDADLPGSDPASQQLQSEADAAQTTPRANAQNSQDTSQSQVPPTSSPLFYQSSPAGSQSQSQSQSLNLPQGNGINISSPLRQQVDAGSSQGGRTPRLSGAFGGQSIGYVVMRA
jgi:DNA replication licensing factor MCM4